MPPSCRVHRDPVKVKSALREGVRPKTRKADYSTRIEVDQEGVSAGIFSFSLICVPQLFDAAYFRYVEDIDGGGQLQNGRTMGN